MAGSVILPYSAAAQEQYGLPAEFTLDHMPERLIVMTMGPTEILHELGVEMIAVPDIIDESQEWAQDLDAQRLPFTAKTMDTESIVALKPDMIIMSAGKKEAYGDFLESQGIPVYYTVSASMDGGAIDSVKEEVRMYGNGFGRTEELAVLMNRFDQLEASIDAWKQEHANIAGQKMMILLECPFTYTNTSSTTLGGMLRELGYENMADSIEGLESVMGTSTLQISSEVIVEQNPPLIIAQPAGVGAGISITSEEYKTNLEAEYAKDPQVWESIEAVKNDKVLYLGTDAYPGTTGLGIFKCYEYLMEALPKL